MRPELLSRNTEEFSIPSCVGWLGCISHNNSKHTSSPKANILQCRQHQDLLIFFFKQGKYGEWKYNVLEIYQHILTVFNIRVFLCFIGSILVYYIYTIPLKLRSVCLYICECVLQNFNKDYQNRGGAKRVTRVTRMRPPQWPNIILLCWQSTVK